MAERETGIGFGFGRVGKIPGASTRDSGRAIVGATYANGVLTFTHGDGAKHSINLPSRAATYTLTAEKVAQAINHGTATGPGSIKSLEEGWWVIPATDPSITGRPSGAQGDLIYHIHKLGSVGAKHPHAMGMILGKNRDGQDALWVAYRDGDQWTSWWEIKNLSGAGDVSTLRQDVEALKQGNVTVLARIARLETALGNIFAPTQLAFDAEANKLIDAKLAPIIAAEVSAADVENYLKAKGWGPLSRPDIPKTPTKIQIYAGYDTNFPTDLTGFVSADTNVLTLTRAQTSPARIFVAIPEDHYEADAVTGIKVDDGLKAVWESRDRTIDGKAYRLFFSPGAFYDTTNKIEVVFGG